MFEYKNSKYCLETSERIIYIKTERQMFLLKKYKRPTKYFNLKKIQSINGLLLEEARIAKYFWSEFNKLLPDDYFNGRNPGKSDDVANKLLDVGYHHITNIVKKILEIHNIPPDVGLFHVARNADSCPLAYDLVEMFRSDIVDTEVLKFLRLKKRKVISVEKEIAIFIYRVNKRSDKEFFLKDFGMCHTYRYYMELQILKFIKSVNHNVAFIPVVLPTRHENRC